MTDRSALVNLPALPRGCRGGGCVVSAAPRRRIRGVGFPLLPTPRLSQSVDRYKADGGGPLQGPRVLTLDDLRSLSLTEVESLVGLRKTTIYKRIKDGQFPPPVRLSTRKVGWRVADIRAWLQSPDRQWDPTNVG